VLYGGKFGDPERVKHIADAAKYAAYQAANQASLEEAEQERISFGKAKQELLDMCDSESTGKIKKICKVFRKLLK
jgi:hypothetical protein